MDTPAPIFLLTLFNGVLLLISIGSLIYLERNHIKLSMSDIGMISACGAEKKHFLRLFIVEFVVTTLVSALIAFGLSALLMYGVIYTAKSTVIGSMWIVFTVKPLNALIYIAAYIVLGLIALIITISSVLRRSSSYLISTAEHNDGVVGKNGKLAEDAPVSLLKSVFSKRTKGMKGTMVISIPLIAVVLAVFYYLTGSFDSETSVPDTHFQIVKTTGYEEAVYTENGGYYWEPVYTSGFSEEDIAYLQSISYIADVTRDESHDLHHGIEQAGFNESIWITLKNTEDSDIVYEMLINRFGGNTAFMIYDLIAEAEAEANYERELYTLVILLFSVILLVMFVVVYLNITGYVETQTKNIYLLRLVGTEGADIYKAFMRRAFHIATVGIIVSIALGYGLFLIIAYIEHISFGIEMSVLNAQNAIITLTTIILFYAAFLLPTRQSVKKKITVNLYKTRGQALCQ